MIAPVVELLAGLFGPAVEFFLAPRNVGLGENWVLDIERELRRANCGVAFVSDAAAVSKWVLFEAGVAYGLGIPFIPLGTAGFRIERQDSPLAFLQGINLKSAAEFNDAIGRLATSLGVPCPRLVTAREFAQLFGRVVADAPPLQARSFLTRRAVYRELCSLVNDCGFNSEVRAMTTVIDDTFDRYFSGFLKTVAAKCGTALKNGGGMYYRVALGFHREDGAVPQLVRSSIRKRFLAFEQARALPAAQFFEIPRTTLLDVLMINREHAVIAFPRPEEEDSLQFGIHFSGHELVNPLVNWFDSSTTVGAVLLRPEDFLTT